jgi:hypothetical protein
MADSYGLQRPEDEARAKELRRLLDARIAEADRADRTAATGADEAAEEEAEEQPEETPFLESGALDPAFVEVHTPEYQMSGGRWIGTGRYLVTHRRRRPEDGTEPVAYERAKLKKPDPPAVTWNTYDEWRKRVVGRGVDGPTSTHMQTGAAAPDRDTASFTERSSRFAGWSRDG